MIRKVSIGVVAIFALMQLLSACCDCEEYPTLPADWKGAKFRYGYYTIDAGKISTGSDTSRDFSERGFILHWQPSIKVLAVRYDPLHAFCNAAYACKCDDARSYNMLRDVIGVSIRTLLAFDTPHPAGSEVTALFKRPNSPVSALMAGPPELPQNLLPEFWISSMYLDGRPERHGPQQFELVLMLSDGALLRDTTEVLRF